MNIARNMEFIFVGALVVAATTCYALAAPAPAAHVQAQAASQEKIQVVRVVAKRLSAQEKAKLAA
jgi:hypothetical protein